MPWFDHEGGSEASFHTGEKYKNRIAEYLRARGNSIERRSDHHATTEDLAAVGISEDFYCLDAEKVSSEFEKRIRVEAKAGEVSRLDESFVTELARTFLDYHEQSREFEYHIYSPHFQAPDKWKRIFKPRVSTKDAIKDYYDEVVSRHSLNDQEEEKFREYEFEHFKRFLEDVFIHRAGWDRLEQMTEDEQSVDRSKWDFYTKENRPYDRPETLIPNFHKLEEYPDYIYVGVCTADRHRDVYEANKWYSPIWIEGDEIYSLTPPEEMEDSLLKFIETDSIKEQSFDQWLEDVEKADEIAKRLFNRFLKKRGVENYDTCKLVRHDYENRLIFQHNPDKDSVEEDGPEQTFVEGWKVTMERGRSIAHRYGVPQFRQYDGDFYVFVETGWLFSRRGYGNDIISGDQASKLHDDLQSDGYHRPNNFKAQFRQWRSYLDLTEEPPQNQSLFDDEERDHPQAMYFSEIDDLEVRKRPPKDTSERNELMSPEVDSY